MGSPTLCTLSKTTPLPNSNGPTGTGSPSSSTGLCREYPGVLALATLLLVTLSAPCSASRPLTAIDKVPKRLDIVHPRGSKVEPPCCQETDGA